MPDSIHKQCLDAIRADIITVIPSALAFCEAAEIQVRRWPWDERQAYPGITIWEQGQEMEPETTQRENVAYRCVCTFIVPNEKNNDPDVLVDRLPAVIELIRRRYTHKRIITSLTLSTGVFPCICKVQPNFRFDPPKNASWTNPLQYEWRHLLIRSWVKENAA